MSWVISNVKLLINPQFQFVLISFKFIQLCLLLCLIIIMLKIIYVLIKRTSVPNALYITIRKRERKGKSLAYVIYYRSSIVNFKILKQKMLSTNINGNIYWIKMLSFVLNVATLSAFLTSSGTVFHNWGAAVETRVLHMFWILWLGCIIENWLTTVVLLMDDIP